MAFEHTVLNRYGVLAYHECKVGPLASKVKKGWGLEWEFNLGRSTPFIPYNYQKEFACVDGKRVDIGDGLEFVKALNERFGSKICIKEDGSLDDLGGVELAVGYGTYSKLYQFTKDLHGFIFSPEMSKYICVGADGFSKDAGVHVHISRNNFKNNFKNNLRSAFYTLCKVLYDPNIAIPVASICGRHPGLYHEAPSEWYYRDLFSSTNSDWNYFSLSRYTRVKLKGYGGTSTVEIRAFKSSNKLEDLLRYLEFSKALLYYVNEGKNHSGLEFMEHWNSKVR